MLEQDSTSSIASMLAASPFPAFLRGRDGRIRSCNESFAREILSVSVEGAIGRVLADFEERLGPSFIGTLQAIDRMILSAGGERVVELQAVPSADSSRDYALHLAPWLDEAGTALGVLGFLIDRTAENRLIEYLSTRAALLENVTAHIPHLVFWKDMEGVYLGCNRNFLESTGKKSMSEIVGRTDHDLPWTKVEIESYRRCDRQVVETGKPILDMEESLHDQYGGEHVIRTSKVPLRNGKGDVIGVLGIATDITSWRRTQDELLRLQQTIEQLQEAVVVTDGDGSIQYVNPAFVRLSEYARNELMGKSPRILKSGRHDTAHYRTMWDTILSGETWSGSFVNRKKSGALYEVEATISPVADAGGKLVHIIGIAKDVTHQRSIEAKARTARSLEAIGRLAAGLAHEINTPAQYAGDNLRFIEQAIQTLSDAWSARDAEATSPCAAPEIGFLLEELPAATRQVREGLESITQIVQAMKTCSGGEPGLKLRTDVNELIRDVLVICNSQCARIDKVATDLDPGLPAVIVSPFDLSQAILNLLMNAIQAVLARPAGADPTPGLVAIATALAGDWVEIRIEDNGTGMTPEIKSRIFDQFFSTRQIGSGTGLGLPYAQSVIVQHHRGELDFESEPGRGTTFRIRLPIEERPGDEGPEAGSLESAHEAGRPGATGVENLEF